MSGRYALLGLDPYSGSEREVSVRVADAHVGLTVEGTEALLTPAQCDAVAKWLKERATETGLKYAPE